MATSKNYGKKKGSDHFRDILNPYGEKSNYGKIGRRRRLSKLNVLFFSIILSVTICILFTYLFIYVIEGSLEVKLPTIWRDEKAVSREKSQKRKDQKKEDAGARKGRKVAKHCVFSWFCGSGGLKSRLAKAAGAETSGEMRDEKLHAVVARSRFRSEKVQNTSASDHFWKLRCWKSARRCGAKQISKWKGTKHLSVGPLLEVEMLKKCTALWREADLEVKCVKNWGFGAVLEVEMTKKSTALWREAHLEVTCVKNWGVRSTFGRWDVEKVHAVVARSTFGSKKC